MKKLTEIKIRQTLLYIAWVVYIFVWSLQTKNRTVSVLEYFVEIGIPWVAVMLAAISLANKARAWRSAIPTDDFWRNIEH